MIENLNLCLTLYSFSSEYINHKLSMEEILRKAKEMGYRGIEIIPAQMAPDYPYLTDKWLVELRGLLEKYDLDPVCWSAYLDMGLASGRELTRDEIIQFTVNDLIYAKKAGFPMVRSQYSITPDLFREMIPYCKKLNMKLTIEMHHPHHPKMELWREYIGIMRGEGKGYLGLVPDFGIFIERPHKLWLDQALELGFDPDKLEKAKKCHEDEMDMEEVFSKLELNEAEMAITQDMYNTFNKPAVPEQLKDIIDVSFYMHGKFYYAEEGESDQSIPYAKILKVVKESGYKGYIACEYEGHHFTDAIPAQQQLERFVTMCRGSF